MPFIQKYVINTVKSRPLAALVDKPQVYFVDVDKCVNEVCLQRWRIQRCPLLRMRVTQVNESAHLNSVGNLIPPTDWPTARVPWADHHGRACGWVG